MRLSIQHVPHIVPGFGKTNKPGFSLPSLGIYGVNWDSQGRVGFAGGMRSERRLILLERALSLGRFTVRLNPPPGPWGRAV